MKKILCIILVLIMLLMLTGCSLASDQIITFAKNAWLNSSASGTPENYEVRHLHFDDLSVLKEGIGRDYQDFDWLPDSGDIFLFVSRNNWYISVLDAQGNVCDSFSSIMAEATSYYVNKNSNKGTVEERLEAARENLALLDRSMFFQAMVIWQSYIGEPSYENIPGKWHSLTNKEIERMLK